MKGIFCSLTAVFVLVGACGKQQAKVKGIEDIEVIRVKCVTGDYDEVTLEDLQHNRVCDAKNFVSFCRDRFANDISAEQREHIRHTVAVLKELVDRTDCMETFEKLKKMTFISLHDKGIVDISPLIGLNELRHLDLSANSIADIAPIQKLKQLTVLALASNALTTIPIMDMPRLRRIYLKHNSISDLTWLRGMPNLRRLVFNNTAYVDPDYQGVSSLDGIQHLKRLDHVEVVGVNLKDASQLAGLTLIKTLNLKHNAIESMPSLKLAKYLKDLNLSYNSISSLDFVATNRSLQEVDVSHNVITALTGLQGTPNLRKLIFSDNRISDISPLAELYDLEVIALSNNTISDLTPLQRLHQLTLTGSEFENNPVETNRTQLTCPIEAVSADLRNYCRALPVVNPDTD